jgi:hypothetical protein
MRTNRQLFVLILLILLILLLGQLAVACSGGNGGGNGGGSGGGNGGGQVQVTGKWDGNIQITERREVDAPPPTQFPGQKQISTRTLSGTLTLQLEQQGSSVSASGDGSVEGSGWGRDGPANGSGTITAGARGISFTTFELLGCALTPFTATVTDDSLTADVTGMAASPLACVLVMGHLQLHRTG